MPRVLFGGKSLREPTAAAQIQIGVQPTVNPNATSRVAVIGPSDGGIPQQVYTFSSYSQARAVLRGGDSLKAISYVFNPSPLYGGASQVDFIRSDASCTAGSLALVDSTPVTPLTAFTVTSVDKGVWTNGIQVTLAGGTVDPTSRVITVKVPDPAIQSGMDGTATVTGNIFSAPSAKFISNGARAGDVLIVPTVVSGNITATAVKVYTIQSVTSETDVVLTAAPTAGTALAWFHVRYSRIQTSPEIAQVGGASNINAGLVNWINSFCGDVLTATTGAANALYAVATTGANPLVGGTQAAMTNADITDALALIATDNVNHIYVAHACGTEAGELDFATLLTGHLNSAAETPAIGYIGAMADKTVTAAEAYAATVNSGRMVYCMQTILDTPLSGIGVEEVPGYLMAAKVAGLAAGLAPETPLTRKPIAMLGIKALPGGVQLDKTTREALIQAGILHVFQPVGTNTFVVNDQCSTLQNNDDLWDEASGQSSQISLMRINDSVLNDLKVSAAATFLGSTATLAKPVLEHFVASYLESVVGTRIQSYSGVTITQSGSTWNVQFGIVPNYPVEFILITGTIVG